MSYIELGALPFVCFLSAVLTPITSTVFSKRVGDAIAVLGTLINLAFTLRLYTAINDTNVVTYRFGGFPPPLGVVYVADGVNSILAIFVSFALFISILQALWLLDSEERYLFYTLAYLLVAGVYGCLFTNDIFNLYVSIELVAISSYVLTGFYRGRRAVRAALIYGISGTVVTSFLLLSVFVVYGAYGTLNMVDIALKVLMPDFVTPFSGGVVGDIVLSSKVALALTTWVLLFKSGIIPNHFWLPEAYMAAPLPAITLFTAAADIIGVYGLLRLYYMVFPKGGVIDDYRSFLLNILLFMGIVSTVISAVLVSRQTIVRKLVAYSSISQFSLALLGVVTGVAEGVAGSILHLVMNGLGDIAVLHSTTVLTSMDRKNGRRKAVSTLSKLVLVVGLLNLFGIIPIFPGFWSKAFLTLGFINFNAPWGAAVILISAGLCAIGYLRVAIRFLALHRATETPKALSHTGMFIPTFILLLLFFAIVGLGTAILIFDSVRNLIVAYGSIPTNVGMYIKSVVHIG